MGHTHTCEIAVIGGGAGGFFAAIHAAEAGADVVIFEQSAQTLAKVRISGGGRCNVTHACYEPRQLVQHYPRGHRELLGAFHRFGPGDTVSWYENRGVTLKTEDDGRMFPDTDSSETITACLEAAAAAAGVRVHLRTGLEHLIPAPQGGWNLRLGGTVWHARAVILATGSSTRVWNLLEGRGLRIVPPVPSLFTFHIRDGRLRGLAGLSVPHARLYLPHQGIATEGPLLITHWGISGPATLRMSAWGARALAEAAYQAPLRIDWTGLSLPPKGDLRPVRDAVMSLRHTHGRKQPASLPLPGIPARLWQRLLEAAGVEPGLRWADLRQEQLDAITLELGGGTYAVNGKSTFKEEFVTCGGLALDQVDFRSFAVRGMPGLYAVGEMLDVDALTGGFNFQAAWTGGFLAGTAAAAFIRE